MCSFLDVFFTQLEINLCLMDSTILNFRSLRSWILKHQPPVAPNFDMPVKGNLFATCKFFKRELVTQEKFPRHMNYHEWFYQANVTFKIKMEKENR